MALEHRRTLAVAGVTINYCVRPASKPGTAPPFVLLHGLASNRSRWSEFVRETRLAERHDLLRLDLRGHGESMTRKPYDMERWCADLQAILKTEGYQRVCLLGHSLGAGLALHFAARHAEHVAGLVLIDPVFPSAIIPQRQATVRRLPLYAAAAHVLRFINCLGLYRRRLAPLDLEALDREAREALKDPGQLEAFVRRYSSAREDLRHIPHANYLQDMVELLRPLPLLTGIEVPILLLRSTQASHHDEAKVAAILAAWPKHEQVFIDCHHWPVTERPEEIRALVEDWAQRVFR